MSEEQLPEGIHTVELVYADVFGILRGKKIPANQWERLRDEGSHTAGSPVWWGVRTEVRDDTPDRSVEAGIPDMAIRPEPDTLRVVPWKPGVAQVFCTIEDHDGNPHPLCARNAFHRVLDEFAQERIEPKVALEMEFFLLDGETHLPLSRDLNTYGIHDNSPYGDLLIEIQRGLVDFGLPVETSIQEFGRGQLEITLQYGPARRAVHEAILMRHAVKELAAARGLVATYMSKPFDDESGSGLHIHHSLWRDDENLFAADADRGVPDLAMHYLGGLQRHIRDLSLLSSWSITDYKRRQEFSFSPTTDAWGGDNRTVALRMIEAHGSYRFEQRDGSPMSNLYLAVTGQLAAGLDGMRNSLLPRAKCEGNAYTDPDQLGLPRSVPEALARLRGSALSREVFGDQLIDTYLNTIQWEYEQVTMPVSDLERRRYIGVV